MRGKVHGRPGRTTLQYLNLSLWAGQGARGRERERKGDGKEGSSRDGWMGQQQRHHRRRSRDILPSLLSGRHSLALTHAHAHNTHTHMRACPSLLLLSLSLSLLFLLFEESCVIWHRNCRRRRCHITRRCSVRLRGGKDDSFAPRVPPLPPLPSVQKSPLYHFFSRSMGPRWPRACPACLRASSRPPGVRRPSGNVGDPLRHIRV